MMLAGDGLGGQESLEQLSLSFEPSLAIMLAIQHKSIGPRMNFLARIALVDRRNIVFIDQALIGRAVRLQEGCKFRWRAAYNLPCVSGRDHGLEVVRLDERANVLGEKIND